jgi:hypothetical protein
MAKQEVAFDVQALGDVTGDGYVDHRDLLMIQSHWHLGDKTKRAK